MSSTWKRGHLSAQSLSSMAGMAERMATEMTRISSALSMATAALAAWSTKLRESSTAMRAVFPETPTVWSDSRKD